MLRTAERIAVLKAKPASRAGRAMASIASNGARGGLVWWLVAVGLAVTGSRGRRAAARGIAAMGIAELASAVLKRCIRRPRPVAGRSRSSSFPSAHTAAAAAFATGAGLSEPWLAAPLLGGAAAVGWSRVARSRHFPTDVATGAVLGIAAGAAVLVVDNAVRRRRASHETTATEPPPAGLGPAG